MQKMAGNNINPIIDSAAYDTSDKGSGSQGMGSGGFHLKHQGEGSGLFINEALDPYHHCCHWYLESPPVNVTTARGSPCFSKTGSIHCILSRGTLPPHQARPVYKDFQGGWPMEINSPISTFLSSTTPLNSALISVFSRVSSALARSFFARARACLAGLYCRICKGKGIFIILQGSSWPGYSAAHPVKARDRGKGFLIQLSGTQKFFFR